MEIVINNCFGGFGLSEAQIELLELAGEWVSPDSIRQDPRLIASVKGGDTGGRYANLVVRYIPDDVHWEVHEYDGSESIIYSKSEIHWS
jgi:hypothetical protein